MNSKDFQQNALKTESIPEEFTITYSAAVATLNIAVEAAKAVDVIKKALYYGKPIDNEAYISNLRSLSVAALEMRTLLDKEQVFSSGVEITSDTVPDVRILHGALGMFTEAGEMLSCVRDYANGMNEMDEVNFREEIGDSDWYKAILLDTLNVSEEEIRAKVIAKLRKRYADKFSSAEAIERDTGAERAILEGQPASAVEQAA